MSEELHPYNDFFKKKLENHESSLPDDLFDKLMHKRAGYNDLFQKKLGEHESLVTGDLFDRLMRDREGSDELPTDEPLRDRILGHSTAVPNDMFNDIIAERERRRRAFAWRSVAAVLLFLGAYFLLVKPDFSGNNHDKKTEKPIDLSKDKSQATNDLNKKQENKSLVLENENSLTENKNSIENKEAVIDNENKNIINSNKNLEKYKDFVFDNKNKSTTNDNKSKNTEGGDFAKNNQTSTANNQSTISNNQSKNMPVQTTALTNATKVVNTTDSQNTVSNSANYLTNSTAEQQIIIPTILDSTTAAVTEPNNLLTESGELEVKGNTTYNSQLSTQSNQSLRLNTESLSFENLSIFKLKNIALPSRELINPCTAGPGDGCPTFGRQRKRGGGEKAIYVDVFGAPEYAFRRLSENLPEMTKYLQARDSVEKPWYAFSAGARASLVFENGLALRTGLVYAQTNEIAVFDSLGVGSITYTFIPRLNGRIDTVITIISGIFRTRIYNRYRSIDIPLQLGFEFPMNDYWTFSVNGGVNFNVTAWRKAHILGDDFKRQQLTSGLGEDNSIFRNSLGLSINGSVAAYRQLTGNLQLMIEPSVRYNLQPITRSDYALKQAYTNVGLKVGLRFRL